MQGWRMRRSANLAAVLVATAASAIPAAAAANPIDADAYIRFPLGLVVAAATAIAVETAVAALSGVRGRALALIAGLNLVTNVSLNLFLRSLGALPPPWALIVPLELAVVLVEWAVLMALLRRSGWAPARTLGLSAFMNVMSYLAGAVVFTVLPQTLWVLSRL